MDPKGDAGWVPRRVIKIQKLFPNNNPRYRRSVIGFADGVGVIFVKTDVGIFMMELKSGRKRKVRKVSEPDDCCGVIPFMSFYTPGTVPPRCLDLILHKGFHVRLQLMFIY